MIFLYGLLVTVFLGSAVLKENAVSSSSSRFKDFEKQLNESIEPCDNFYEYVCGKIDKEVKKPPYGLNTISLDELFGSSLTKMDAVLGENVSDTDIEPVKLLKRIFQSCSDTEKRNELGLRPLFELIPEIEDWPLKNDSDVSEFDWKEEVLRFQKFGIKINFPMTIDKFLYVASLKFYWGFEFDKPSLSMDEEFYSNVTQRNRLKDFLTNTSSLINGGTNNEMEIDEIISFEEQLANCSGNNMMQNSFSSTFRTMANENYEMFEPIGLLNYTGKLLFRKGGNFSKLNEIPLLFKKSLFSNVNELLQKTPKRVLKNYLLWRFIQHSLPLLSEEAKNLHSNFKSLNSETNVMTSMTECQNLTSQLVPNAYYLLYAKQVLGEKTLNEAEIMAENIKKEYANILNNSHLLSNHSKSAALEKLQKMKIIFGYSKETVNDSIITLKYKTHSELWNKDEFYLSVLKLQNLEMNQSHTKPDGNGAFNPTVAMNFKDFYMLIIQSPILKHPIFDPKDSPAENYGLLGTIIGHEISHIFDQMVFGSRENPRIQVMFREDEIRSLITRADQLNDDFYKKKIDLKKFLEVKNREENIADNVGVLAAYLAFRNNSNQNESSAGYPGFTTNQIFWIQYAKLWCNGMSDGDFNDTADIHSPNWLRVNVPLENNANFASDFNCPLNSKMNPAQKNFYWE